MEISETFNAFARFNTWEKIISLFDKLKTLVSDGQIAIGAIEIVSAQAPRVGTGSSCPHYGGRPDNLRSFYIKMPRSFRIRKRHDSFRYAYMAVT
jgi:hypothetical protein